MSVIAQDDFVEGHSLLHIMEERIKLLLTIAQRFFHGLTDGDVPGYGVDRVSCGKGPPFDPTIIAVFGAVPVFETENRILLFQSIDGGIGGFQIFRMNQAEKGPAYQFGQGVA